MYSIILKMIATKTRYQELLRVYEKEMTMKVMDRSVGIQYHYVNEHG